MSERSFEDLARDLERLEAVVDGWSAEQKATVSALRRSIEDLHKQALTELIRAVKAQPGGIEALKHALERPAVAGVLGYHGLIRKPGPTLEERVEEALVRVRPALATHEGDVELVAVNPPDEVQIRLLGTCNGCAFSDTTVQQGIEQAIRDEVPEITKITVVPHRATSSSLVQLGSKPTASPFESPWEDAGAADEVPAGAFRVVELTKASVLLTRAGESIRAYPNACTHLGMPLDDGAVDDGVLTCPYHGFKFVLASGECITAPETQLVRYPVRVVGARVEVQVTA